MHASHPLRAWGFLLALVMLWGTAFLFIKIAVAEIPPATLVAARVSLAAVVLTAALYAAGQRLPTSAAIWSRYLLMAAVGNVMPFSLISWGQTRVGSGTTGILMAVMPLVTLVLAHFFVAGERMTARSATGFVTGAVGLAVLSGPEALRELAGGESLFPFQAAILAGAVCYAVNTILARRLADLDALASAATVMWCATLQIVPLALWLDGPPWQMQPAPGAVGAALWLGVAATALATILYFELVASAGPTFLSLMNYLIPVVALGAGVAVFGEPVPPSTLLGLLLILAGLAISQLSMRSGSEDREGAAPAEAGLGRRRP